MTHGRRRRARRDWKKIRGRAARGWERGPVGPWCVPPVPCDYYTTRHAEKADSAAFATGVRTRTTAGRLPHLPAVVLSRLEPSRRSPRTPKQVLAPARVGAWVRCCCEFRARCISVRALRRLGGSRRRRTRRVSGCGRVRGKGSRARREDALPPARRLRRSRSAVRAAAGSSVPPRSGSLSPPCVARVLRDMTQIRCRAFRMTQEMRRARRPDRRNASGQAPLPSIPPRTLKPLRPQGTAH